MVGAGFRIGGRHVALLPGMRIHASGEPDGTLWDYKYPGTTIRPSLAITAGF